MIMNELDDSRDMIISQLNCSQDIIINQIQNAVTQHFAHLQANMTTTTTTIDQETSTKDDTMSYEKYKSNSRSALQVSRRQSTATSCYRSLLGTMYIRRTRIAISTNQDGNRPMNKQTKNNWSFFPAFLSRCVELQFQNTYSSIFRGLRTYQVIDENDPIINICYEGHSTELQNYFDKNRHRVSPFVVEGAGRGLLYVSDSGSSESSAPC